MGLGVETMAITSVRQHGVEVVAVAYIVALGSLKNIFTLLRQFLLDISSINPRFTKKSKPKKSDIIYFSRTSCKLGHSTISEVCFSPNLGFISMP